MNEHDSVVLVRALPVHGLQAGDVGAIVNVYAERRAYEVEFVAGDGATLAVVTLEPGDIRPLASREVLHARQLAV